MKRIQQWTLSAFTVLLMFMSVLPSLAADLPPPNVLAQGNGWQRLLEPLPGALGTQSAGRDIVVVNSLTGLEEAPLPEVIKDELRHDLAPGGLAATSATNPQVAIAIDLAVAQSIAAGTETQDYAAFVEPDEEGSIGAQALGCGTHWRSRSFTVPKQYIDGFEANDRVDRTEVVLGVSGQAYGEATFSIGYQFRKSRFCVPYAVRFASAHVHGFLDLNNTALQANGGLNYTFDWKRHFGHLFDYAHTFMLGPVPMRVGVQMPFGIGFQAELGAQLSLGVAGLATGRFVFDYTCTLSDGCISNEDLTDPSDDTTVRFETDGLPDFTWGVTAQALAKPYAYVELWAYLYHPWFAAVGVGLEASLPSTVWYGYGEHCGDADGNNDAELVNGGYFDVNAQLSLYWLYNLAGRSDYYWLDWDLAVFVLDKWKLYEVKHHLRDKSPFWAIRKNLFFQPFQIGSGLSPLTPVIAGNAKVGVGASNSYVVSLRRLCLPLEDAVTFEIEWGDNIKSPATEPLDPATGLAAGNATASHFWTSTGNKTLKVKALHDSAGRQFGTQTQRVVSVESMVPPAAPTSINVPASSSTGSFTLSWSGTLNTIRYEIQRQLNGGAWVAQANVNAPSTSQAITGLAIGNYRFRVRSCNAYGCSSYKTSGTLTVGNPPDTPALTVISARCNGLNDLSWTIETGATSYRLWRHTSNSPGSAIKVYDGTQRYYTSNAPNRLYYWVQACNAAGCSALSAYKIADPFPGCL